jgi:hypothetical protein
MSKLGSSPADSKTYFSKKPGSAPAATTGRISTPVSPPVKNAVRAKGSAPKAGGGGVDLSMKHSTKADTRNRKGSRG